jgi:anti-sigma B factor antagonist
MSLDIVTEHHELSGISVVKINGEVDLATSPQLRDALRMLLDANTKHVVIDLSQTKYLDSSALGILVDAAKKARGNQIQIHLSGATQLVRRALEITQLSKIFDMSVNLSQALKKIERVK